MHSTGRMCLAGSVGADVGVSLEEAAESHHAIDRALELDPEFALGYAAKARDFAYSMGRPMPRFSGRQREAQLALEQALALSPNIARNPFSDPVLDQPEFVEVRNRIRLRLGW